MWKVQVSFHVSLLQPSQKSRDLVAVLQFYFKMFAWFLYLQVCEGSLQHKTDLVGKLEEKTNQMANTIKDLETRYDICHYFRTVIL